MKVFCGRDPLREALSAIATALPTRTTKPVLETVLFEASGQSLTLTATDLEVAIRYTLQGVSVESPGTCLVRAREAADFVHDLSDETVNLEALRSSVRIYGKEDECELALADVGEFSGLPDFTESQKLQLSSEALVAMLERTAFSAAKEIGRFAMNGVRAEIAADRIRMIATDGRRLSLVECPLDGPLEKSAKSDINITIPIKAVQQFIRVLSTIKEVITLSVSPERLSLQTSSATILTRLLEGEFPRYQAVVPKEGKNVAECDTKTLAQKIRLVAHLCPPEQPVVRFKFMSNSLTLTTSSPQRGEARAEMPVHFMGAQEEVAFNPEFVLDGLKASKRDTIRLEFNDRTAPGKFHLNENHEYVVMPVVNE
ncbi:MAG: DNA polymerase III subunit beta [Planctomycetes bacterium]|nr:DNA polymerase III subunit beta [Planctomycetota bacterium]